ncbi:raffinose/stachyose/melibiose transport system substrate-binding protein [Streptacidiphilus sp. MAP12-20]|uniref:ABC transporter substrate-binding protein n=1 Tax=Streptacidiphilus sp. MAP12-20 TaxID=3156299 RepID=UPI00351540B6
MRNDAQVRRGLAAAATALVLSLSVAACGNSGGVGGSSNAGQATVGAGQKVTLNYWTWFPAQPTLQKSIAAFEAANPNITIKLREFSNTDYQKELPLALNSGQSLDVVGVQVSAMTNTVRTQLRPVGDWAGNLPADWKSKINPAMLAQTQDIAKDKTLYSIPMGSIGSAVVYSNADVLAKLGISFPKTQADLAADVAKVKAAGGGVAPVVFSGEAWWQDEMFFTVADQIDPKLSDELYTGKVAWNSPQLVKALTAYQNLFKNGTLDKGTLSLKETDADNTFNSGKAAFLVEGSWNSSVLSSAYRKANGITVGNVGAGAFPVVVDGGQPAARTFAEGGLAIPKSSKYAAQAAKFIQFMTTDPAGVSTWASDLVLVPSLNGYAVDPSVLTTPEAQSGYAAVQALISAGGSGRGQYSTTFTTNVLDNTLLDVARGNTAPQAAADSLQSAWASGRYPVQ